MANVKVYLDPIGNTMNIWWDDPKHAYKSEETRSTYNNDVIIKNKKGIPIGLEIIGVFPEELNIVKHLKQKYQLKQNEPHLIEVR